MSGLGASSAVLASLLMLGDGPDPIDELDRDGVAWRERQRQRHASWQRAELDAVALAEEKRQRRAAKRLRDKARSEGGRRAARAIACLYEAARRQGWLWPRLFRRLRLALAGRWSRS